MDASAEIPCYICMRTFRNVDSLRRHLENHSSRPCLVCGEPFKREESINSHYLQHDVLRIVVNQNGPANKRTASHVLIESGPDIILFERNRLAVEKHRLQRSLDNNTYFRINKELDIRKLNDSNRKVDVLEQLEVRKKAQFIKTLIGTPLEPGKEVPVTKYRESAQTDPTLGTPTRPKIPLPKKRPTLHGDTHPPKIISYIPKIISYTPSPELTEADDMNARDELIRTEISQFGSRISRVDKLEAGSSSQHETLEDKKERVKQKLQTNLNPNPQREEAPKPQRPKKRKVFPPKKSTRPGDIKNSDNIKRDEEPCPTKKQHLAEEAGDENGTR